MNKTDRLRLQRLKDLMLSIPLPQAGGSTQSSGFTGYTAYASDMRAAQPIMRMVIEAMIYDGLEGWYKGQDYQDADGLMDGLEAWIKVREGEQWCWPSRPIEPYIAAALLEVERRNLYGTPELASDPNATADSEAATG